MPDDPSGAVRITFLLVVRNEKEHVGGCLASMLDQTLPSSLYEIVIVDGMSTDGTREIIAQMMAANPGRPMRLLDNPHRILSSGWNIGLRAARGEFIIRLDAHGRVPRDFLERSLACIEAHPEAAAVGGVLETVGQGFWGQIIASVLSSRMGVGGSRFRVRGAPGAGNAAG